MRDMLYFKPLHITHDSGFNYIEYGYCNIDNKDNAVDIEIIGRYDAFHWRDVNLHIDLTKNGYFRILNPEYKWDRKHDGELRKK